MIFTLKRRSYAKDKDICIISMKLRVMTITDRSSIKNMSAIDERQN